jgi:hypothetical protein
VYFKIPLTEEYTAAYFTDIERSESEVVVVAYDDVIVVVVDDRDILCSSAPL